MPPSTGIPHAQEIGIRADLGGFSMMAVEEAAES
jgi:hypothetical protein